MNLTNDKNVSEYLYIKLWLFCVMFLLLLFFAILVRFTAHFIILNAQMAHCKFQSLFIKNIGMFCALHLQNTFKIITMLCLVIVPPCKMLASYKETDNSLIYALQAA